MEYATLNNGIKMPMAGIGTFLLTPDEAETSVLSALFLNIKYLFSYVFLRFLSYLYIAFMHNNTTYSHILSFYSHGTA